MNNEGQATTQLPPLSEAVPAVDRCGQYQPPTTSDSQSTTHSSSQLTEAQAALHTLACEFELEEWAGTTEQLPPLPRACKKKLHSMAAETGRASRGYGERKKKGKPIDKKPLQRQLLSDSNTKLVITGPDFVGCTTLLQQL
jgi:hypothetical protein